MKVWPLGLLVLLGCQSETAAPGWTVTESDGVRVVEIRATVAELPEYASVGEADLTIGSRDGSVEYVFGSIGAVRSLPGGGVLVTDEQDQTVRIYSEAGEYQERLGGRGDGPGEFRILFVAGVAGDSIWAWDPIHQRVTLLSIDGETGPAMTFDHEPADRPFELKRLEDGSYLARSRYRELDLLNPKFTEERIWTDSLVLRHLDVRGENLDTIAITAAVEVARDILPSTERDGRPIGAIRPFGAETHWAADAQGVSVTVEGRTGAMTLRDVTGRTKAEVRFSDPPRPLPPSEVDRLRNAYFEGSADDPGLRRLLERVFSEEVLPETMPRAGGVEVGSEGEIWVRQYATFPEDANEWIVFSPGGVPLGRVVFPDRFEAHEFGPNHVLGVQRDELDVEYVRRLPLERVGTWPRTHRTRTTPFCEGSCGTGAGEDVGSGHAVTRVGD